MWNCFFFVVLLLRKKIKRFNNKEVLSNFPPAEPIKLNKFCVLFRRPSLSTYVFVCYTYMWIAPGAYKQMYGSNRRENCVHLIKYLIKFEPTKLNKDEENNSTEKFYCVAIWGEYGILFLRSWKSSVFFDIRNWSSSKSTTLI